MSITFHDNERHICSVCNRQVPKSAAAISITTQGVIEEMRASGLAVPMKLYADPIIFVCTICFLVKLGVLTNLSTADEALNKFVEEHKD